MKTFIHILLGIAGAICIICAAVTITLNCIPLYESDIKNFDLEASTGLPAETILENYKAMVDYNNIGGPNELVFPAFPMSEGGRIHFMEVRRIFHAIEYALIISAVITALGIIWAERKKQYLYRLCICIFTVALPAAVGIFAALAWDTFFVTFHHLMFNNDYWIFDSRLDPVITILPDGFFLHCIIMIVAIALAGATLFGILFKLRKRAK